MHERIIELKVIAQYIDSLQQNPKSKDRTKEPAGMEPMLDKSKQVSIWPTFYEQLFCTKAFRAAS